MSSGTPPFRDVAGAPKGPLDAAAWQSKWEALDAPWDLGEPSPPLAQAVADGWIKPPGRVLVPGLGRGHDALMLADAGFDVVGIDISAEAVRLAGELAAEAELDVTYRVANVVALPGDIGTFDAVVEHTCFCAIDPALRDVYVDAMSRVLRPGGALIGVFFVMEREDGPPFGATEEELRHRFATHFEVEHMARPESSLERRDGIEMLALLRRRG